MRNIDETLEEYGADLAARRLFDDSGPGLLPYATLVAARDAGRDALRPLIGVYEWQNAPLIFLVDGDQLLGDNKQLQRIRRLLAMRGDAPYLGVVRPGQLTIYRLSLNKDSSTKSRIASSELSERKQDTFTVLINNRPGVAARQQRQIYQVVLNLLGDSIDSLKDRGGIDANAAISLAGRALFARFLGDRDLLPPTLVPRGQADAAKLFDNAEQASSTSTWLDETFNGDFLPLDPDLFQRLPTDAYRTLGDIMRRADGSQLALGWQQKWDYLDFAHIPVGVLSQAYERYLRKHAPLKQRKEGGYYTPQTIADLMVRGAFYALRSDRVAHKAKVLDPAAGAGVFLISAFRQLVAERWAHDGVRPDTATLREILYGQIRGFDINEAALRFAALGLYLISIELDPHPEPVQKLRFENLRGTVLHRVGDDEATNTDGERTSWGLGSLGGNVDDSHNGCYDLVISNPPWASATGLGNWSSVLQIVSRIARKRNESDNQNVPLPNEVLDLPFVWRAMEWAKPGSQMAFALHARLLFQQGEGMPEARRALLCALDVTGVINGAELRQTKVWPDVSAPFCLVFARNQPPSPSAGFRFLNPRQDNSLTGAGELRVDTSNADIVTRDQVARQPEILKILFRGTQLDREIYDRISARDFKTLKEYWKNRLGDRDASFKCSGSGYQKLRKSSKPRRTGDGQPGVSAEYLADLLEYKPYATSSLLVDVAQLHEFKEERIHDPRPRSLFLGPLTVVHKSPSAHDERVRVSVAETDVVFSESYYGYSAHGDADAKFLTRYLALLLSSKFALWHALMTSGEFGVERDVIEMHTIDNLPIPAFEDSDNFDYETAMFLFDLIVDNESEENWSRVDKWVACLYGLRERDLQVISDTLEFNLPFSKRRKAAQNTPSLDMLKTFQHTLQAELAPWAERISQRIEVLPAYAPPSAPWSVIKIVVKREPVGQAAEINKHDWIKVLHLADQLAATEVMFPDLQSGCLWLGRLNQARYWSRSQARLVARRVVWEHMDLLLEHGGP